MYESSAYSLNDQFEKGKEEEMSQIRQDYQQMVGRTSSTAKTDIDLILKNFAGNLSNSHVLSMSKCLHLMEAQVIRLEEKKQELLKKQEMVVLSAVEEIKKVKLEQDGFCSFELSKSVFDDKQLCYKKYVAYLDKLSQVGRVKGELMDVGKSLFEQISLIQSQLRDYHYIFENIKVSLETLIIPEITRRRDFAQLHQSFTGFYGEWMEAETQLRASFLERGDLADLPYSFKKMLIDAVYDEALAPETIPTTNKSSASIDSLRTDLQSFFRSYSANPELRLQAKLREYLASNEQLQEGLAAREGEAERRGLALRAAVEEKEEMKGRVEKMMGEVREAMEDSVEWEEKYHRLKKETEGLQGSRKNSERANEELKEMEAVVMGLREELAKKNEGISEREALMEAQLLIVKELRTNMQELEGKEQALGKAVEEKGLETGNLHQINNNLMSEVQLFKSELEKERERSAGLQTELIKAVEEKQREDENRGLMVEIARNYESEIEEMAFKVESLEEQLAEERRAGGAEVLRELRAQLREKEEVLGKALDEVEVYRANAVIIEGDMQEKLKQKEVELCRYSESIVELEECIVQLRSEDRNDNKLKNMELELSNNKAYVEELRATIEKNHIEYSSHTAKLKEMLEIASKGEKEALDKLSRIESDLTKSGVSASGQRRKDREQILQHVAKALDAKLEGFVDRFAQDSRIGQAENRLSNLQKTLHEHQINILKNSLK
jgi:hypothetical protein